MNAGLYCPVTGLKIKSDERWVNTQTGKNLKVSICSIGDSILYSAPSGRADTSSAAETVELYRGALASLVRDPNNYIQIEDLNSLESFSMEVRKLYGNIISGSDNLTSLIFCNVSPKTKISIKITAGFHITGKHIHFCRDYSEAIKLALKLAKDKDIPVNQDDKTPELTGLVGSNILSPIKVEKDSEHSIITSNLNIPVYILNDEILYAKPVGKILQGELKAIEAVWTESDRLTDKERDIRYMLLDVNHIEQFQSNGHRIYGKILRKIHKKHPLSMYISFSSQEKFKNVSKVANALMPFEVRTARDLRESWKIIQDDRIKNEKIKAPVIHEEKKDELLDMLDNINWKEPGMEIPVNEDHPQFVTMTAFKLIKKEMDILLEENRQKEAALQQAAEEKQHLLHELQHRVKNSFSLMTSMIQLEKGQGLSAETMEVLSNLEHKFEAISDMYDLLNLDHDIENITLDVYLKQLIHRHGTAQQDIRFVTRFDEVSVHPRIITPIGLIVTELITNSVKHAFKNISDKEIKIVLIKTAPGFILEYSDNGTGSNKEETESDKNSLGEVLISALAGQIDSSIYYPEGEGFHCTIKKNL